MRTTQVAVLLLALAWGTGAERASAQRTIEAVPVRGLSFGNLLPGVPETVAVDDAARRAEVVLDGRGAYDLTMLVPAALESAGGARIPLRFGTRDGGVIRSASAALVPFDPRQTTRVSVQQGQGPTRLVLGGTALPAADQPAGRYTATVVLVINNPGT